MSYQALYRQWRPLNFDEIIGQSHITGPLKNQIQQHSIGHAYVFSGTRGTGKTSTAKVFSRAVNCLNNTDGNPCNECENCLSILDDQFIDVIEMDAASNNSVDDIREIREHIKFAPSNGKFKVYIIDEVHMLSSGAFNALLKTLEEPPSYVLFILATTEVHKIPQTILSRCQRFDFKRVSQDDVYTRLTHICEKLKVKFEPEALRLIIRKSDGAVRDSLSSLDQCLSASGPELTVVGVIDMLGLVEQQVILDLIRYMSLGKSSEALTLVHKLIQDGKDINQFVGGIIDVYRDLLIVKLIDENHQMLINASQEHIEVLIEMSNSFTEAQISRGLEAFILLSKNIKYAQSQRIVFEATLVKVLHPEADSSNEALLERISKLERVISEYEKGLRKPLTSTVASTQNTQSLTPPSIQSPALEASESLTASSEPESKVSEVEENQLLERQNETTTPSLEHVPSFEGEMRPQSIETRPLEDAVTTFTEFSEVQLNLEDVNAIWSNFLEVVGREKKGIFPALDGAKATDVSGQKVTLSLTPENRLFIGVLESKSNHEYLQTLLGQLTKQVITLCFDIIGSDADNSSDTKPKDEESALMDFFKDYKDVLEIK